MDGGFGPVELQSAEVHGDEGFADAQAVGFVGEIVEEAFGFRGGKMGHAARGDVDQRVIKSREMQLGNLGHVPVAAQDDDFWRTGFGNQIEQAFACGGKFSPRLERMFLREDLRAGTEDDAFRVACGELIFEPLPLSFAEHVTGAAFASAETAFVEQDNFEPFARRSEVVGGVNAGAFSARTVRRFIEKIEECGFALLLETVFRAAVVFSVVMVVPDADDFGQAQEFLVPRHIAEHDEFIVEIGGVAILRVDDVAEPDPDVGSAGDDGLPDGRFDPGFVAGAERDAMDDFGVRCVLREHAA